MRTPIKNSPKVLGLDISTKTIGWALFDIKTQDKLKQLQKSLNLAK